MKPFLPALLTADPSDLRQLAVTGTPGDDVLTGTPVQDQIHGEGGDDTLFGLGDADILGGGDGADVLYGGDGRDALTGWAGDDRVYGGAGEDVLYGAGGGVDAYFGGADWDTLSFQGTTGPLLVDLEAQTVTRTDGADHYYSIQSLILSEGDDRVHYNRPHTRVYLGGGDDRVVIDSFPGRVFAYGGDGTDTLDFRDYDGAVNLYGGRRLFLGKIAGFEVVFGSETHANMIADPNRTGPSLIVGGAVADRLLAMGGADTLNGQGGDDWLSGDTGNDLLIGGDGNDRLDGGYDQDRLSGGTGNDWLTGSYGEDTLTGDGGNDTLYGGAGEDRLHGGADNDRLGGGDGDDHLIGGLGDDVIVGGAHNDSLFGQDGNDSLFGATGTDALYGGDGDDVLVDAGSGAEATIAYGGAGDDTLLLNEGLAIGGTGNDTIVFSAATTIYGDIAVHADGGAGNDRIHLDISLGGTVTGGLGDDFVALGNADIRMVVEPSAQIDAGPGRDTLMLAGGINLHLEAADYLPFPGAAVVKGFERVILTGDDNRLIVHADGTEVVTRGGSQTLGVYAEGVTATLGAADDQLFIGRQGGRIDAGAGDDQIYIEGLLDGNLVLAGAGNDQATLEGGGTTLMQDGDDFAYLRGWYNDTSGTILDMGAGNDLVWVQSAFTRIALGAGDDEISVSVGTPVDGVVSGGGGADRFIFGEGIGRVVVQDFEIGVDRIRFDPLHPLILAALTDIRQVGGNTELLYLSDPASPDFATLIVLQGITATDLTDAILF